MVGLLSIVFVPVMLSFFHEYCTIVEGRYFSREYSQMKADTQMMNKPAVMSIKTAYGDVYDCIDIYRQPAFDHPSLKNHTLQMKPSFYPDEMRQNDAEGGGCPNGTVPIRRTQKNNFLQSNSHLRFGKKIDNLIHQYATVETAGHGEYYGARAYINVWNPQVPNATAISLSQLWIVAGPTSTLNTIEVGWVVCPTLYGDSRTRLFSYWTADGYGRTGCYNVECPGFIQVNGNIPVDISLDQVSTYNGRQYDIKIDVIKDPKTGNWFLLKDDLTIGYWPSSLYSHLNTKADTVGWGGEVAECAGCLHPQMGNGYFPNGGYGEACYMSGLQVIDNTNMVMKDLTNGVTLESNPNCYKITYNKMGVGALTGSHIIYGGSGGTC